MKWNNPYKWPYEWVLLVFLFTPTSGVIWTPTYHWFFGPTFYGRLPNFFSYQQWHMGPSKDACLRSLKKNLWIVARYAYHDLQNLVKSNFVKVFTSAKNKGFIQTAGNFWLLFQWRPWFVSGFVGAVFFFRFSEPKKQKKTRVKIRHTKFFRCQEASNFFGEVRSSEIMVAKWFNLLITGWYLMGCDQMILTFDAYPPQHHRVLGDSPKHILTMNMEKHGEKKKQKRPSSRWKCIGSLLW